MAISCAALTTWLQVNDEIEGWIQPKTFGGRNHGRRAVFGNNSRALVSLRRLQLFSIVNRTDYALFPENGPASSR
jgi:hypothetical protein